MSGHASAAWLQAIGTATPRHDVHAAFVRYARGLLRHERERLLFDRMAERGGIGHRYSVLRPGKVEAGEVDADGFYRPGDFPGTAGRMALYAPHALRLALQAVRRLAPAAQLAAALARVTHLVVATCTGFSAPGLDVQLVDELGLRTDVQRSLLGFMGCSAALPALRLAQQTVLADPTARVLVVNVELCTLHLRESDSLEELLSFLIFADGASAAFVGSDPEGAQLLDFRTQLLPASRDLLTWDIGDAGFVMHLSGRVPGHIAQALSTEHAQAADSQLLRGRHPEDYALWAVHAGGRTVLDAVQRGLSLPADALDDSRAVLQAVGNVSSATVMFVLQRMLQPAAGEAAASAPSALAEDRLGLALAFGPGLTAESLQFRLPGRPSGGTA